MRNLLEIQNLIAENNITEATLALKDYINANPDNDQAYYLLGNMYRKSNDWRNAINNYCQAIELNPNSPAKEAYEASIDVLNFYNTALFNP